MLAGLGTSDPVPLIQRLSTLGSKTSPELAEMYHFDIVRRGKFE
jgi:hypothetical protein